MQWVCIGRYDIVQSFSSVLVCVFFVCEQLNQSPGWWEKFIGPGAPLDTNKFFIVCANLIGGCFGSRYYNTS